MIYRLDLIQILGRIPEEQLSQIIFALDPPRENIPSNGSQGEKASALLRWAESPVGCGLNKVEKVLDEVMNQYSKVQPPTVLNTTTQKLSQVPPIYSRPMYILHLSDLHFGNESNPETRFSILKKSLQELREEVGFSNPNAIIISGDIADKSTLKEYDAAFSFLNKLVIEYKLDLNKVIIVPGNHDVNWEKCDECYKQVESEGNFSITVDPEKYKHRFGNFSSFYKRFHGVSYPLNYEEQAIQYTLDDSKLIILGLNSAWKLSRHEKNDANIKTDALNTPLGEIGDKKYKDYLKIAVWHHPVNSSGDDKIKDNSFLKRLASHDFCLGLHGHIHKDDQQKTGSRGSVHKIDILAAGTFGAPAKELRTGYPWQYQLLKIEGNQLQVYTRKRMGEGENEIWEADLPYPAPITLTIHPR